jgi:predicted RNA-binding protein with PIN domain
MPLIIDGYNLLNVVGIIGRGVGPGGLERARLALMNFLAESLEPEAIPKTIVVFDSREAPWGLPRAVVHRGLSVQYASKYPDADCLIEELIQKESAPRKLVVVSSDHRLQRAARRRRARAVDSDVWYNEVLHARRERQEQATTPARPTVPLLPEDVEYWLDQFGGEKGIEEWMKKHKP